MFYFSTIKEVYEQTKILSVQTKTKLKNLNQEKETPEEIIKALRSMTKTKKDSVPDKELQIKQLQASLEKEKKLVQRMQEENCLKQTKINTINQKLITIHRNYENRLKDVKKLQDDIKRINKEKEGEQERLSAEIDYNKRKIKSIEKDKAEPEKQYSNLKSIDLKLETKIGHQDKERTTETYSKQEITQPSKCYARGSQEH